jgi:hypothetical protein
LSILRKAATEIASRPLDKRSTAAKLLARWRSDLERDLGGAISTQQSTLIDLALKTKLFLDAVDGWLLRQRYLVTKKRVDPRATAKASARG